MTTTGYQVVLTDRSLREVCTDLIEQAGANGITVAEARALLPERHHGHVSGVFSKQHEKGNFARLVEERDGYHIYIHPDATYGRPTDIFGSGRPSKAEVEWALAFRDTLEYWFSPDLTNSRFGTDKDRVDLPGNRPLFVQAMRKVWSRRP
jgi:hypothetical protein